MSRIINIRQHPKLTLAALLAIGAAVLVGAIAKARSPSRNINVPKTAWFSTDNGRTWFADDVNKWPPFDHDGKQACRVYIYTCDGGKTKFAAFLSRFTPEARRQLMELRHSKMPPELGAIDRLMTQGLEIKKPGNGAWVNGSSAQAWAIRKPVCPDGKAGTPQAVLPS